VKSSIFLFAAKGSDYSRISVILAYWAGELKESLKYGKFLVFWDKFRVFGVIFGEEEVFRAKSVRSEFLA
jgi:hypothetical protein